MTPWLSFKPTKIKYVQINSRLLAGLPRKIGNVYRDICLVYKTRKETLRRNIPNKKIIANSHARYVGKSILIHRGLSENPAYEMLGDYKVHFFNRETFIILFNEIFLCNEYNFTACRHNPLILDCGSNIGMSILYFKMLYPNAKIIAFEPDDETFAILEKNVKCNNLNDVQIYNRAISNKEGEIDFYYDSTLAGSLLMSPLKRDVASFTAEDQAALPVVGMPRNSKRVASTLLSSYINETVDFLKMDIEGGEHAVIEELAQSSKLRLIEKMVIEYHHNIHPEAKNLSAFLGILEENDFGYQLSAHYSNFTVGVGMFQNVLIFAYNKKSCLF